MKRIIYYNLLIVICLAVACKKIDVEPTDGDPVFRAAILVDENLVELKGGVEGYYMFTSFEKDANDVHSFIGKLKQEVCDSFCGASLEIQIRDVEPRAAGNLNINEALVEGSYKFYSKPLELGTTITEFDTTEFTQVELLSNSTGGGTAIIWESSNGDTFFGPQALFTLDSNNLLPTVTLKISDTLSVDGLVESTSTQQLLNTNQPSCSVSISPSILNDSIITQLEAVAEGANAITYNWGNSTGPILTGNLIPGEYAVTITDANGCTANASYFYTNEPANLQARFDYSVETVVEIDSMEIQLPGDLLQFSRMTVVYTSADGIEYRSDRFDQPGGSTIELLEIEDFDENENEFPTKKITLRFNCMVWNDAGEVKSIESLSDVIWGVAYPE